MIDAIELRMARGEARQSQGDSVINLPDAAWRPAAGDQAMQQALLAQMRAGGWRLDERVAAEFARANGFAPGDVFAEGQRMVADEMARLSCGGGVLELTPTACGG